VIFNTAAEELEILLGQTGCVPGTDKDRAKFNKFFSGNKPCQLRTKKKQRFRDHLCLHHQGKGYQQLTWFVAREFIEFRRRESFKSYMYEIVSGL
jgi:hypothetical protein